LGNETSAVNAVDVLIAILEGILGALLATVITVLAVNLVQPKLRISPSIATRWSNEAGELRANFKIVNQARRPIVDLRFELVILYRNEDGKLKNTLVERQRPEPMFISGRSRKRHQHGDYVIAYGADLLDKIIHREVPGEGRCGLRLRIFGRDGLSGKGRRFEMKYDDLFGGTIVYGSFEPNASLMVTAGVDANPQWAEKLVQAKAALTGASGAVEAALDESTV